MSRTLKTQKYLLRQEREQRGWSQAKVAEVIGTTTHTIGRWERGLSTPYPFFREKLCALFEKDAVALGFVSETTIQRSLPVSHPATPSVQERTCIFDPLLPLLSCAVIGRSALFGKLKQQVCKEEKGSFVALNGLPGVGKTTLAVALALDPEVQQHFPDGILWAGLGMSPNSINLLARWGTLLGVSFSQTKERTLQEWMTALRMAIGSRRFLLILDDVCDESIARALQVGGSRCAYLLTTRIPQIAYAWAGDQATLVSELEEADGITLLAHFAPQLIRHDQQTATELVQMVGGLPLALCLIGKYLGAQEYSKQPRRLHTALQRLQKAEYRIHITAFAASLGTAARGVHMLSVSLQSVIAVSEAGLTERERTALYALSVFPAKPNSFSEAAALAVIEAPSEVLDALCDVGLVECGSVGRYTIHKTITDYARSRYTSERAIASLVSYYMCYVEEHTKNYTILEQENANILIALHEAFQLNYSALFVQGVLALFPFWNDRGFYTLAEQYLTQAYQCASTMQDAFVLATLCHHRGLIALFMGKSICADTAAQEGLRLIIREEHPVLACGLLNILGSTAFKRGEISQADMYYQEEYALAQQSHLHHASARCLANLEVLARREGKYVQAEAYLQELLALAKYTQDYKSSMMAHTSLGVIAGHQGNFAQAATHFQHALTFARPYGKCDHVIRLLTNLGYTRRKQEDYAGAESNFAEALQLAQQSGHKELLSYVLENLGDFARERGQYTLADTYLQQGLTLARQLEHQQLLATFLKQRGELLLCCQNFVEAKQVFQELLSLSNSLKGNHTMLAFAQYGLARLLAQQGAVAQAYHLGTACFITFTAMSHEHACVVEKWLTTLPLELRDEGESIANDV